MQTIPLIHPPTTVTDRRPHARQPDQDAASTIPKVLNWLFDVGADAPRAQLVGSTAAVDEGSAAVLVLDASGSMLDEDWPPSRLEAAKDAARQYCARVAREEPHARIGILAYGSSAKTLCGLTPAAELGKLQKSINRIKCLGGTNIRAGLKEALRVLSSGPPGYQIVLLSDGHNMEKNPLGAADRLKARGTIDCVGIGGSPGDVDEDLLKDIASANPDGTKRYRWIGGRDRLVKHFHNLAGRISRT